LETANKTLLENNVRSVEQVQKLPFNVVVFSEDMIRRNRKLKDFLYTNLYRNYRVQRMAVKADRILSELFALYLDEPAILPKHVLLNVEEKEIKRVICDYIAGMTDRYAIDEYKKLFDPTILP